MVSNRQAARSGEAEVVSRGLFAVVLAISCLAAGTAVGQGGSTGGPTDALEVASAAVVGSRSAGADHDVTAILRSVKPRVRGYLPAPLWGKLASAYRVALESIRSTPSCSALFASRGAVGFELLMKLSFAPAAPERDQAMCARSVAAVTEVGGHQVRLCPRFETLSPSSAALVLIHETLHDAGMSEKPPDPSGLTSAEINRLVEANCGR